TDWLWIDVLQNANLEKVLPGVRAKVYWNLMLISELDPLFHEAYYAGANLMTVINDDHLGALTLLAKGKDFLESWGPKKYPRAVIDRYWAQAWRLPMIAGYIRLFELGDMNSAAAEFVHAAAMPNAPVFLQLLSKRFAQPGGEYEVGMRLINFMLLDHRDGVARAKLEKKRRDLYLAQYLDSLSREFMNFSRGHATMPKLEQRFAKFLKEFKIAPKDPWGGKLFLDASGRVMSTTKRERVFGLE
ncbi:MAG: hypothetical protein AAB425_07140, partial [Bdellovibrionota bacterium]